MFGLSYKDKEEEMLRELEIESILEETRYLTDQEKMEQTARKYRAKPEMVEIFSNASKKPRLVSESPLDLDREKPEVGSNDIVGEKTAATIQAQLIMEGEDDEITTPQAEEAKPEEPEEAVKEAEPEEEEDVETTLSPEYGEGTTFSKEVLGEVEQFADEPQYTNSNIIDIDMSEVAPTQKSEAEVQPEPDTEEKPRASKKVVSKVPVYKPDKDRDIINVKAGRFSEVVANEYEEYIRSKNPSVIAHVIRPEPKETIIEEEEEKDTKPFKEKMLTALVGFFSKDESDDDDKPKEQVKQVDDYTGEEEEEKSILFELNLNIKKLFGRSVITGAIALLMIILTVVTRLFPQAICSVIPFAPAAYAVLNFLLVGFSLFVNRVAIVSGLTPLVQMKGNSDTAVAVGGIAAMLQTLVSFFCLDDLSVFSVNYYCVVVLLAFFANNLGKLYMVRRVKENFRFVASKGQKYAAKIYNNEAVASEMMSGTAVDRPIIAYHHKTDFPANFLKISYAPDPSEDLASKLAPMTTIAAVAIAVIYGFARGTFTGAVNALALVTAIAIPVATLVAVNLPVFSLCKKVLSFGGMLSGYPSIKQFCDSTAVMVDANELFPRDCVSLEGIKTYEKYGVDESLLCGIAILKEAKSPIAKVFESVVAETNGKLPDVESVLYEDEMGLVGWIKSERILVGSRQLLEKYNVDVPRVEYEEKYTNGGKQVTYLSRAGRLVAMFVTRYKADPELKAELHRAEINGISWLIRTTDCNITNDLIASLFDVFYRSIKVLPTGLGNVLKEAESTEEESSRSYLITGGKVASLGRAVSGCVKIKHNISLAIIIQLIAVILGILIAAPLALYAGVGVMGSLEVLMYALFWAVAAVIAPAIQRP